MKIYYLTLILFCFLYISCSSDDDTPQRSDGRIVVQIDERSDTYGVWRIHSIVNTEPADLNSDGRSNTNLFFELPFCFTDNTYSINPDGSYILSDTDLICEGNVQDQELERGTYKYSKNNIGQTVLSFTQPEPTTKSNFKWLILNALEDPETPDKRYLELDISPTEIGADILGIESFNAANTTMILVTDK